MAKKAASATESGKANDQSRSLPIAERGIKTSADFASLMSALISDLAAGRMSPQIGNAMCNASGKLLKIEEMRHRYGGGKNLNQNILQLAT